jgi:hypothetical protein
VKQVVDHGLPERASTGDRRGDGLCTLGLEQLGGIQAGWEFDVGGVEVGSGELPEGFLPGCPAGGVGVGGPCDVVASVDDVDVARSSLIWFTVSAVPIGAMPTASPLLPSVMARASMGL